MYDDVNNCPVRIPDEDGSAPPLIEPSNCHKGFPIRTCGGPIADECLFPDECPAHPFVRRPGEGSVVWESIKGCIEGFWMVARLGAVVFGAAGLLLLIVFLAFAPGL